MTAVPTANPGTENEPLGLEDYLMGKSHAPVPTEDRITMHQLIELHGWCVRVGQECDTPESTMLSRAAALVHAEIQRRHAPEPDGQHIDKCPNCEADEVGTFTADQWFLYGRQQHRLCAKDVEFFRCMACGCEFTGEDGERKRDKAVRQFLRSSQPEPAAEPTPMAWIGLPEGAAHNYDMVYDGTRKLPGYRYLPIWRPEDHPSTRHALTKESKP